MTNRFVSCAFCFTMGDFQRMAMCPLCRKVICKRCQNPEGIKPGKCAKKVECERTREKNE